MDKKFIGNVKKHTFQNGSTIFKMGFPLEDLKKHVNSGGWVNIILSKKKQETGDPTKDYYMYIDDYKPAPKTEERVQKEQEEIQDEINVDGIPF